MRISGAIFDMDGTLIDSMNVWRFVGRDYLQDQGIDPPADLRAKTKCLSMEDAALYYQQEFGITATVPQIIGEIYQKLDNAYRYSIPLKDGVADMLHQMHDNGVKLAIATATDRPMVELVLQRLGIWQLFNASITCNEAGWGKDRPLVFEKALMLLGTPKQETPVFEDAAHAIITAKQAGFPVIAIEEKAMHGDKELIQNLADHYLTSFVGFDYQQL